MSDLVRVIFFNDDVDIVFEALSEWWHLKKTNPNSLESCSAASRMFDLFQAGHQTKEDLLAAMEREEAATPFRATAGAGSSIRKAIAS